MALVEISDNVMVNSSEVVLVKTVNGQLIVVVDGVDYPVTKDPKSVLAELMRSMSIPETMMKNNQFFGG